MTAQQVLARTEEILRSKGWSGGGSGICGAPCVEIAMREAATQEEDPGLSSNNPAYCGALEALAVVAGIAPVETIRPVHDLRSAIWDWNDARWRTQQEVFDALRAAYDSVAVEAAPERELVPA